MCTGGKNDTGCAREYGSEVSLTHVLVHMGTTFYPPCTKPALSVEKNVEKNGKLWKKVEKSLYFCVTLRTELK